jgi:ribonucleoside-diphosphate reductase beta chain
MTSLKIKKKKTVVAQSKYGTHMNKREYSTFSAHSTQYRSMFLGPCVDVARYDQQSQAIFEHLTEAQLSFFWRPQEINLAQDRINFRNMSAVHKDIFVNNLKYQIMLDSVQGRAPNVALLPLVSSPELESFIITWSFMETIHSRSYTHMIRALFDEPSKIFDEITLHPEISKRAESVTKQYDELIYISQCYATQGEGVYSWNGVDINVNLRSLKKSLILTLHTINALEAIRFQVSFVCNFAFSENKIMDGSSKIMRLIARDEALHSTGTTHMLNIILQGRDQDPEMTDIAHECLPQAHQIFMECVQQEKLWAKYIFRNGAIPGLNELQLCDYIDYLAYKSMRQVGLSYPIVKKDHCIKWVEFYLKSHNVQVAPQETEVSSYLSGQINTQMNSSTISQLEL